MDQAESEAKGEVARNAPLGFLINSGGLAIIVAAVLALLFVYWPR